MTRWTTTSSWTARRSPSTPATSARGPASRPSGSSRHRILRAGTILEEFGARSTMSRTEGQGPSSMRDVRVAVVGCGAWGKNLVRNFAELGALEALVDPHPARVDALVAQHGGRALSFEAALADPAIEAFAIAA